MENLVTPDDLLHDTTGLQIQLERAVAQKRGTVSVISGGSMRPAGVKIHRDVLGEHVQAPESLRLRLAAAQRQCPDCRVALAGLPGRPLEGSEPMRAEQQMRNNAELGDARITRTQ